MYEAVQAFGTGHRPQSVLNWTRLPWNEGFLFLGFEPILLSHLVIQNWYCWVNVLTKLRTGICNDSGSIPGKADNIFYPTLCAIRILYSTKYLQLQKLIVLRMITLRMQY